MTKMKIPHILAFLAVLLLTPPIHAEDDEKEGGIIGTGIVGTVTHLGSIHVNGQHIQIDRSQKVADAIGSLNAGDLQPGHTVAVTVRPEGDHWRASKIRQIFPLVGPVETVDETTIKVLGTRVLLDASLLRPAAGDWVAVSGLWQGKDIKASRLDLVPEALRQARIGGTYFAPDANGKLIIGNTAISGITATHLEPGDLVRAFGAPSDGGLEAVRLERHLFGDEVRLVQIEGHLSEPDPSGLYTVLGSGMIAYTEQPDMIDVQTPVILCNTDPRFVVQNFSADDAKDIQHLSDRLDCPPF